MHSSWTTLPSRNSSWGSYDTRPSNAGQGLFPYDKEEIPWHPGTVKRTKQKLEENTQGGGTSKRVCTQNSDQPESGDCTKTDEEITNTSNRTRSSAVPITITKKTHRRDSARLSSSAPVPSTISDMGQPSLRSCRSESETSSPSVVETTQCPSVKHHKMVLESLLCKNGRTQAQDDSPPRGVSGIVKNLKREFEAKSTTTISSKSLDEEQPTLRRDQVKVRSLPSSPVIGHAEPRSNSEDLSVRVLVGKYDPQRRYQRKDLVVEHPPARARIAPDFARRSAPVGLFSAEAPGRPPAVPTPSTVVASVVVKAAIKKQQQQHGRTHPLARLQVRPRHSSPVYNTM